MAVRGGLPVSGALLLCVCLVFMPGREPAESGPFDDVVDIAGGVIGDIADVFDDATTAVVDAYLGVEEFDPTSPLRKQMFELLTEQILKKVGLAKLCLPVPLPVLSSFNFLATVPPGVDFSEYSTRHPNWMRWVPDETEFRDLSIPGTHNSMAFKVGLPEPDFSDAMGTLTESAQLALWNQVVTQALNLEQQLLVGIRFLDIRCRQVDDEFDIYHGVVSVGSTFDDVLSTCRDFLSAHPSEVILMRVKPNDGANPIWGELPEALPEGNTLTFTQAVEAYMVRPEYAGLFWLPRTPLPDVSTDSSVWPTVGEARGKIILLPDGWVQEMESDRTRDLGIPFRDGHGTDAAKRSGTLLIHDDFEAATADRWPNARAKLEQLNYAANDKVYVTFVSGTGKGDALLGPLHLPNACSVSDEVNPQASYHFFAGGESGEWGFARGGQVTRTGIVVMDYPGEALLDLVIAHNFDLAQDPFALGDDFRHAASNTIRLTAGSALSRLRMYAGFWQHMLPQLSWNVACLSGSWGVVWYDLGLSHATRSEGGFRCLIQGVPRAATCAPTAELETFVRGNLHDEGSALDRAQKLHERLNLGFAPEVYGAGIRWNVLSKKEPGGFSRWAYTVNGTVRTHEQDDLDDFYTAVWAWDVNDAPQPTHGSSYTVDEGTPIQFDASGTSDPEPCDEPWLQYRWDFEADGAFDTNWQQGARVTHLWPDDHVGSTRMEVRDPSGAVAVASSQVTVRNVAPSMEASLNGAGPAGPLECGSTLEVSVSFSDPGVLDTHTVTVSWGDGVQDVGGDGGLGGLVSYSPTSASDGTGGAALARHAYTEPGDYVVHVEVRDKDGGVSSADDLLVSVRDTLPPELVCSLQRTMLWPAQAGLLPVGFGAVATDVCDPDVTVQVSIYSNESNGVAPYAPDAIETGPPESLRLRAERRYPGSGRIYLIIVTARDDSGNTTVACKSTTVPLMPTSVHIWRLRTAAALAEAEILSRGDGSPPPGYEELIHSWVLKP